MSTQKSRLTVVQRAAAQAHAPTYPVANLLNLYLTTPSKQRDEQFVSTARAAEIAGVSRRTIQSWIDSGDVSAIRIGKCYKVSRESFHEFLENGMDK